MNVQKRSLLSKDVQHVLRESIKMFLESSFNVLVKSIKKDFSMERSKIQENDYNTFLYLISFFFEYHECVKSQSVKLNL